MQSFIGWQRNRYKVTLRNSYFLRWTWYGLNLCWLNYQITYINHKQYICMWKVMKFLCHTSWGLSVATFDKLETALPVLEMNWVSKSFASGAQFGGRAGNVIKHVSGWKWYLMGKKKKTIKTLTSMSESSLRWQVNCNLVITWDTPPINKKSNPGSFCVLERIKLYENRVSFCL